MSCRIELVDDAGAPLHDAPVVLSEAGVEALREALGARGVLRLEGRTGVETLRELARGLEWSRGRSDRAPLVAAPLARLYELASERPDGTWRVSLGGTVKR